MTGVQTCALPISTEHNLTARFTQNNGDASDPEVSYDGKKIVFSMKCPAANPATVDGSAGLSVNPGSIWRR